MTAKKVEDIEEFTVEIVDNAHAVLTVNGKEVGRLTQSGVSDARKALDAAFIQLH